MNKFVRIGTRGSALARWQTDYVAGLLKAAHPGLRVEVEIITTTGDRVLDTPLPLVGGKGVFTAELESALHNGSIDFAVHSLKDLPTETPTGLVVGAVPERENPLDVLVSRSQFTLGSLPNGAAVGTSSRRRAAQLLHQRPDLNLIDIRGNVDTRIRKALDAAGDYDAIVLAYAGIKRLGHEDLISQILSADEMLPAPGQGALGIQCRDETSSLDLLKPINHVETYLAVTSERAFLAGLGGGCSLPVAAYATWQQACLTLQGRVTTPDGGRQIDVHQETRVEDINAAYRLGMELALQALSEGAAEILEQLV
jgi:hydroxymethylbilane synthase